MQVIQYLQQTALQLRLIHSGQWTDFCVRGRWHQGRGCWQAQQTAQKQASCVIGQRLETLQAVAEQRRSLSTLSWTMPPTLPTMSVCNYRPPSASSSPPEVTHWGFEVCIWTDFHLTTHTGRRRAPERPAARVTPELTKSEQVCASASFLSQHILGRSWNPGLRVKEQLVFLHHRSGAPWVTTHPPRLLNDKNIVIMLSTAAMCECVRGI